jgi:hypothetical protein
VASWFERKTGLLDVKVKSITSHYTSIFSDGIKKLGAPFYRTEGMIFEGVESDGRITLRDQMNTVHIIGDGEDILWSDYEHN